MVRLPWAFAGVFVSVAAVVVNAATPTELSRAYKMIPSPAFQAGGVHAMAGVLNRQLEAMPGLSTRPCDEFSARDLQHILRTMFPLADAELLAVYDARDRVMLPTGGRARVEKDLSDLEAQWDTLNAFADVDATLHAKYRDGLCHQTVCWLVHHLAGASRDHIKASMDIPLLPAGAVPPSPMPAVTMTTAAAAIHTEYERRVGCSACHANNQDRAPTTPRPATDPSSLWPLQWSAAFTEIIQARGETFTHPGRLDYDYTIKASRLSVNATTPVAPCVYAAKQMQLSNYDSLRCDQYFVAGAKLWVDFPTVKRCCMNTRFAAGTMIPGWLDSGEYLGRVTFNGTAADKFNQPGSGPNYWYTTPGRSMVAGGPPVGMEMFSMPGTTHQTWIFDQSTYALDAPARSTLTPPTYCARTC